MDLILGDESVPGFTQRHLNTRFESHDLTKALGTKVIANAIKGASISQSGKGNPLHQLKQFNLVVYKRLFLFFGANDYLESAKLNDITDKLTQAFLYIRKHNFNVLVYGIMPLPMYDDQGRSYAKQRNKRHYTFSELLNLLDILYSNNHIPYLNWVTLTDPIVSRTNYKQRLIHGRYPNQQTYKLIANRIASFVKANPKG